MEVEIDYYWNMDTQDSCNLNKNPEIIVGSFLDDWNYLQKILKNENPPSIIDFERLGNTIKIIGELIHKSKNPY